MKRQGILVMLILMSAMLYAQSSEKDGNNRGSQHRLERMKSTLNLNEAQYQQIATLHEKYAAERRSNPEDAVSADEKKKIFRENRAAYEKELNAILTPEQAEKWKAIKAERREKMKERNESFRKVRNPMHLKTSLGLTDEQTEKIKSLNTAQKNQIEALRKSGTDAKTEKRDDWKKIRTDYNNGMKQILSPDQFSKWTEMKADNKKSRKSRHQKK
ncbi:MAG TPA: hypothetical protein VD884_16060 [Ohtaekwangia sp.]|nr:hypothetical protein [Ohtaekwangia sp.]